MNERDKSPSTIPAPSSSVSMPPCPGAGGTVGMLTGLAALPGPARCREYWPNGQDRMADLGK